MAEYKNKKKIPVVLYKNDKRPEEEIRETSPFTIATNNIKYLWVTLTSERPIWQEL